jgi:hypothetical protein
VELEIDARLHWKKTLTIEVAANILIGPDKQRVQIDTLRETIEIQVKIFQRIKAYLADANGAIIATAALVTPLAAILGFFPTVRKFIVTEFSKLRRRRAKREQATSKKRSAQPRRS